MYFFLQALKILIEQHQPCKLTVDSALAYYDLVRTKLGPQQFPEFLEIMRENRNPKYIFTELFLLILSFSSILLFYREQSKANYCMIKILKC